MAYNTLTNKMTNEYILILKKIFLKNMKRESSVFLFFSFFFEKASIF